MLLAIEVNAAADLLDISTKPKYQSMSSKNGDSPMYVFWWTGKGYLTPVIVIATLIIFAVILKIGGPFLTDRNAFWGVALLVAAGANWLIGRQMNAKKLDAVRSPRIKDRLFYKARNKFMSVPFETFSLAIAIFAVWMILADLL